MRTLLVAALLATPAAAAPTFSADRIKADVTFLADDLLEGRGTGQRGHEIAARYVAAQFAVAGLKPGAKEGSWFQSVRLQERRLDGPASLTVTGPAGSRSWANATDVIVSPVETAAGDVEAPVVFAGWGIDAPAQGFDDYAGLDVRGKIVAVLSGVPKGPPNEALAHLQTRKASMAAARGAVGFIQFLPLEARVRRPWPRSVVNATVSRMTFLRGDGTLHDTTPELRGAASLNVPVAEALFAGAATPLATILAEADQPGARPKGFALATRVRIQARTAFRELSSPQVIGTITGTDPVLKHEVVVLMGHLDHLGIRPDVAGDNIYNGALDNAAGIAVMVEVARAFAAAKPPRRTLLFVAVTAEEKGLLGAEAFAADPPVPLDNIAAVVNLDQPLILYPLQDITAFGADHSTIGPVVARAARRAGLKLSPDPVPNETVFVRSDHYALVKRGIPAVFLSTGYGGRGAAAWADFTASRYHQASDDLTQAIDWQAGATYARVNYLIARDLANAPTRPRWYAGDYFGDAFAPGAPTAVRQ